MKQLNKTRGYIYTIPKAGTYLMSEFLELLGLKSTGWHVSEYHYLDTKGFDGDTNRETPSKTKKERVYIGSFRRLPESHHSFGHFSPLFVPPSILNRGYKILCVKRHPKEVLLSEFIDFRYRRSDVDFISKSKVPNSIEAFEKYMDQHAIIIKNICLHFVLLQRFAHDRHYSSLINGKKFYFLDFRDFINSTKGPLAAQEIAKFFGCTLDAEEAKKIWSSAIEADNKTKSAGAEVDLPRDQFWSEKALSKYHELGFDTIAKDLGYA